MGILRAVPDDWEPVELDAEEAIAAAEDGLALATWNREDLLRLYVSALRTAAWRNEYLTVDQAWDVIGHIPQHKGMSSAMGGAVRRAIKHGYMTTTGEFRLSERKVAHRKPLPVYQSLIFGRERRTQPRQIKRR